MKNLITFLVLLCFSSLKLTSQITLSPELGVSYLPFTLYGANTENKSNRIDALIGISAQVPIQNRWFVNTRISFSNRQNIKWTDLCTCPGYLYNEFKHSDFNFDFSIMAKMDAYSFGIGPSFTKKIGVLKTINDEFEEQNTTTSASNDMLGLIGRFSIDVYKNFGVVLTYNRILTNLEGIYSPNGQNRLDFTVSYRIVSNE